MRTNTVVDAREGRSSGLFSIINVLQELEYRFYLLTAEITEIRRDLLDCEHLRMKYESDAWKSTINQLKDLKLQKENELNRIKHQVELFGLHINTGHYLIKKLRKTSSVKEVPVAEPPVFQFKSKIFGNEDKQQIPVDVGMYQHPEMQDRSIQQSTEDLDSDDEDLLGEMRTKRNEILQKIQAMN
ncbi:hypothetical protein PCE1_000689 [Barthelona sp. PCE]